MKVEIKTSLKKLFTTVRGQLTLFFVFIFGLTLCVFSIVLYNVFAAQSRNELDKAMVILAKSLDAEIQSDSISSDLLNEVEETFIPYTTPKQQFVEILNEEGNVIFKSIHGEDLHFDQDWLSRASEGKQVFHTYKASDDGSPYGMRILLYPVTGNSKKFIIAVGIPLANLESALFKFRMILFISIPLLLLFASVFGWTFSKRAYAPVRVLIGNMNSITANNLEKRLPVSNSGDEISILAATLNSLIERLQKSFLVLKQFTSDASHELRTPLTILKGEIEVALAKGRSSDEYEKVLKNNLEEVERLQKIIDGLLMLSQMESGKIYIYKDKIDLSDLLVEAVSKINGLARKKHIRIILNLNNSPEKGRGKILVNGEYSKLLNVFLNLLDNAIKYSDPNSEINCTESADRAQNTVIISIEDCGSGIAAENLENIFARFYRTDLSRTRNDTNGVGLGLAITKAVVEAHGGKILVSSNENIGTTFTVFLPAI